MDIKLLLDAVSVVGFPIVMCLVFMYYVKYLTDKNSEQIDRITEQHREETKELAKAVENNTLVVAQLLDRLGKD